MEKQIFRSVSYESVCGNGDTDPLFLTSAIVVGDWLPSYPQRLTNGKIGPSTR
jgi:hypothetical protein